MNTRKTRFAAVAAVLGMAAAGSAFAASITVDSVVQRWPWNNKVDITYTVEGAQDIDRDVYAKIVFTATIGGTQYTIQGDTLGADASDGTHTVTWTPSVSTKDLECTMTATVSTAEVPSGNDFMIVDLSNGGVTYEGRYRTLTPSTNRYNTATYKTTKMVLRKIPRWSDRATLPATARTLCVVQERTPLKKKIKTERK